MVRIKNGDKLPPYGTIGKLSDVSSASLNKFLERLTTRTYPKGENLVTPGQVQTELYFVRNGIQMAFYESGDKHHVMAFTYAPDICVVPDSFALQEPSKYTLSCLTASTLECITYHDLHSLFDECHDLERSFRILTTKMLAGVLEKHLELKTMRIEERFRNFCERSGHLLNLVPHKHLASYLNIDATNFSKLLNSVRIG